MNLRRLTSAFTAMAMTGAAFATAAAPAEASDEQKVGKRSLATVLAADGSGFDKNPNDFDILENAVLAVLAADSESPVGVLADGKQRLTAFAPTDAAFRHLVADLTGKNIKSERKVFKTLAAAAGIETIEAVLLYHVVPGATITYKQALKADGAKLETALDGATVKVKVRGKRVILVDKDKDARNPRVIIPLRNINKGNKQIAHGIDRVLRPIDLPSAPDNDKQKVGKRSLATVLAADGSGFDKNPNDFDILENAVLAVLAADSESPVGVLADGKQRLTAFAPTDAAFRHLVADLTGKNIKSERKVFKTLAAAAGIETIEAVLLYHVVPGATITYKQALKADGAKLETALDGATVKVKVRGKRVILVDKDKDARNPRVIIPLRNINKGNKQIAHGIDRVLRPIDLP
jgi:uncharacterized surface protein with fasciclin (FAS1) repeats